MIIAPEQWTRESEQIVNQLYFYISPVNKSIIYNLKSKTLISMFKALDNQFHNSNIMILVTKKTELDSFKFKINKTFFEQIIKFDETVNNFKKLDGTRKA